MDFLQGDSYLARALKDGIAKRLDMPKKAVTCNVAKGIDQDRSIWIHLNRPLGEVPMPKLRAVMTSLAEFVQGEGHGAGIYVCKHPLRNPTDIFIQPID